MELLTRGYFREKVFQRDQGICVNCGKPAVDAHHLIDRSLWDDGGYYIENGVSLCSGCHIAAERTVLSCDVLREKAGIDSIVLPEHFYTDERYDKWGNIILPKNAGRIKGELFGNPGVQELLREAGLLDTFLPYIKYPRTYHVPWSPNLQNDDRMHKSMESFVGKVLVATQKRDGENTTMYPDKIHARSLDSMHHESRSWVKQLHGQIAYEIPEGWRICGENMYAEHSIHYYDLPSYFEVFSIWDENNVCLSWDDTRDFSELLGLHVVPQIDIFRVDSVEALKDHLNDLWEDLYSKHLRSIEGYVIRNVEAFPYKDFRREVAKYVRKGHVQTSEFWMTKPVIPNTLLSKKD